MAEKQKDPVCGMEVDTGETQHISQHKGQKYFFCSEECKHKFDKDPDKYSE
jgi:Cu+-exporting ATPase